VKNEPSSSIILMTFRTFTIHNGCGIHQIASENDLLFRVFTF